MTQVSKYLFNTSFEDEHGNTLYPETIAAYERGIKDGDIIGRNRALGEIEELVANVSAKIDNIINEQNKVYECLNFHVLNIVQSISSVIIPHLLENGADKEIKLFVEKYLFSITPQTTVNIKVSSKVMERLQSEFTAIAEKQNLKLELHKDDSLDDNDCVVDWDDGGVSRKLTESQERVNMMFEAFKADLAKPVEEIIEEQKGEENE